MTRPVEILLVEDDVGDVDLIREAFKGGKRLVSLQVARDGIQALQVLRREGPYLNAPRPDLILLDLNMPRFTGREVLQQIKQDEVLKTIPVVVLTTSEEEADIRRMYELGANCYVTKPAELDAFMKAVTSIEQFWLSLVKLPPR